MSEFKKEKLDMFLAVVRKYMQLRGPMTQKELAEITEIGVSTMSRFLNQKTTEIGPEIIGKITAKLNIPFHEIIDFVEEEFEAQFVRLVKFYKGENLEGARPPLGTNPMGLGQFSGNKNKDQNQEEELKEALGKLGTSQKPAVANVSIGKGAEKRSLPFNPDPDAPYSQKSIKEKFENLSPRQKAYLTDFLNLDMESRDLMVDLGNNLFRYFRQKGMDF